MRILMATSDYPPDIGGIAAHVRYLALGLRRRGHEVEVVTLRDVPGPRRAEGEKGILLHEVPRVARLGPFRFRAHNRTATRYIARLARERTFDVVHIHDHMWQTYATRKLGAPTAVVGTMHSSGFLRKASTAHGRRSLAKRLRHLHAITAPSREICDVTDSLALPCGACAYVPNGVDTEAFRPGVDGSSLRAELGLPEDRTIIHCARRIVPKNGVIYLAEAMGQLRREVPDAIAVFAGTEDPEYGPLVRQAAARAGAESCCRFVGAVPNDRMPELMALASVSALPSLVEATSITGLESMASGLPLVGTRVGGIPELVEDGRQGLLVPPADPAALAGGIAKVLADPGLAARLGAAARERAESEFGWDTIASRMEDTYARAIGRRKGR